MRVHDYERIDPFLRALEDLRDIDLLDPTRMDLAVAECRAFSKFLGTLFERVSARAELRDVAFDFRIRTLNPEPVMPHPTG